MSHSQFQSTRIRRAGLLASTCLAACLALPAGTRAQTAGASAAVEEVVVTARKREETLLTVPVQVTALSSNQLAKTNTSDLSSLARIVPELKIAQAPSGNGGSLVMRGIGSSGADAGLEAEVLVDIDGLPTSRGWITQSAFFDIKQVQVLKGPQALFFGKNSPAGVVALTSAGPTDHLEGYARAGYEFEAGERFFEAAVGGPVTSTLGARLAFRYDGMEGWIKNVAPPLTSDPFPVLFLPPGATTNKTAPNQDSYGGRLTLDWKPTSKFTAELKTALYELDNRSGYTGQSQAVHCAAGNQHPSTFGVQDPYQDCSADQYTALSAVPLGLASNWSKMESSHPFIHNQTALASLRLDYDLGPVKLTSITGYDYSYVDGSGNYDSSSFIQIPSVVGEQFQAYSEELRATTNFKGPLNGLFGLYFEDNKLQDWNIPRIQIPVPGLDVVQDPTTGLYEEYYSANSQKTETISPFFQISLNLLHNLKVEGGVRYTDETKDAALGNVFVNQGVPLDGAVAPATLFYRPAGDYLHGHFHDGNWSPEATLTWRPTSNTTLYAAYRTGYKSGGFSITGVIPPGGTIDPLSYKPENSEGFDVGYKAELLNRRLSIDVAGYIYDFNQLQRTILDLQTITFIIKNAAGARTEGIEAASVFQVSRELALSANVAYNHAYYTAYQNAPCFQGQTVGCVGVGTTGVQDLTGAALPLAPEWVATVGLTYEHPISSSWSIGFDSSVDYSSGYVTADEHSPFEYQNEFYRLNASLRLFETSGRLSFDLIGRNLTNQYVLQGAGQKVLGSPGDLTGTIERPRQIMLQVGYRF
jgi:iron complex outermembrane receptor protein